jgi:dolichol-phosphate mannosyltransferase
MSRALQHLSLAAPAYNEAEGIAATVHHWVRYLQQFDGLDSFEIVICNDGSRDQTGEVLRQLKRQYPQLKIVEHATNQGAGAAMATAIAHTTQEWVWLLDADGQFPIENLERFRAALEIDPAPAFMGVRMEKANNVLARFGSWSSGCLCNLFHGTRYRDFNSVCKLVDGQLLRSLPLEAKGFETSTEVSSKLLERHVRFIEVPIEHLPRASGHSSIRFLRDASRRFLFVLYIGFRQFLFRTGVLRRFEVEP